MLRRLLFLSALLLTSTLSHAQGSKADYERSSTIAQRFSGKVFKQSLKPHWFADDTKFWYRNDLRGGAREFVTVDAVAGTRTTAFDHAQLATLLSKVLNQKVSPDRLPVDRLEFADNSILLKSRGKAWRWNLQTNELQSAAPGKDATDTTVEILNGPKRSERTGGETSILFINRSKQNANLFWLGTDGKPVQYGSVAPGKSHSQNTFAGHVWVAKDKGGKLLNAFAATDNEGVAIIDGKTRPQPKDSKRKRPNHPLTSPDGQFRAFFKDHNLHLRDLKKKEDVALSRDGTENDRYSGRVWWSPDSKHVVALRTKQGGERKVYYVESSPADQLQPKLHSYDYLKPGDEIPLAKPQLFNVSGKKHTPIDEALFPNPWSINELRWEPDSSAFTFLYNKRGHQVMRVLSVDATTASVRVIIEENPETFFCYSSKTFLKQLPETDELIWMSEHDRWNHLYLYDSKTGELKNPITRGEWVVREVTKVDEEKRQIWFTAGGIIPGQDPYYLHHARVDFDGNNLTLLTDGDGMHSINYSPDRRFFIDTWSRVGQAPVHELRRTHDGKQVCQLESADISELKEAGWEAPERFVAKGRDGKTDIFGVIVRPTNHDPSKSYPILEDIYAGPHSAFVPKSFKASYRMQSMAELGFIIVKIDGMGTSHRSKPFHDIAWKNLGDSGFPDRIKWIQAAAAKDPSMDLSRIGIYGGSAGGQSSTRALLAHPNFYKVAVSDCGCHDNRVDKIWWNEQWMGWPIGPHYEEQSNVTQAHRLEGKLLLIVGEMDENVDPASTMQVVDALVKADRDFDLLVIPGAGHGAAGTKYGRRRQADYFVRHLLGKEPRWEK